MMPLVSAAQPGANALLQGDTSRALATRIRDRTWISVVATILALYWLNVNAQPALYQKSAQRAYDDVLDDLRFAIAEHNFRITGGNHIGSAIAERSETPFPASDIVHFCNLGFARRLLELRPQYIRHMPCKVVIYQLKDQVMIETQLLDENDPVTATVASEINEILRDIVDYAAES